MLQHWYSMYLCSSSRSFTHFIRFTTAILFANKRNATIGARPFLFFFFSYVSASEIELVKIIPLSLIVSDAQTVCTSLCIENARKWECYIDPVRAKSTYLNPGVAYTSGRDSLVPLASALSLFFSYQIFLFPTSTKFLFLFFFFRQSFHFLSPPLFRIAFSRLIRCRSIRRPVLRKLYGLSCSLWNN